MLTRSCSSAGSQYLKVWVLLPKGFNTYATQNSGHSSRGQQARRQSRQHMSAHVGRYNFGRVSGIRVQAVLQERHTPTNTVRAARTTRMHPRKQQVRCKAKSPPLNHRLTQPTLWRHELSAQVALSPIPLPMTMCHTCVCACSQVSPVWLPGREHDVSKAPNAPVPIQSH